MGAGTGQAQARGDDIGTARTAGGGEIPLMGEAGGWGGADTMTINRGGRTMKRLFPLLAFLARATLVVAVGLIIAGLILMVAVFHVCSAPYRWSREEKGDRVARLEALAAIGAALYAIYQTTKARR